MLGQVLGRKCLPCPRGNCPGVLGASFCPSARDLPGPRPKAQPAASGVSLQPQIQHLQGGQRQARPRVSLSLGSNLSHGGDHAFLAGLGVAGACIPRAGARDSPLRSWRIWPRGSEQGGREGWQSRSPHGTRDFSYGSEQSNFPPSCCCRKVTQERRPELAGPLGTQPGPCKT